MAIQPFVTGDVFHRMARSLDPGIVLVPTDSHTVNEVLRSVPDAAVRRAIMVARDSENAANSECRRVVLVVVVV